MPLNKASGRVQPYQNHDFFNKISIKIWSCFSNPSWTLLFLIILCIIEENVDFGGAIGTQLKPKWCQKSANWRQKAKRFYSMRTRFGDPWNRFFSRSVSKRSWTPFWSMLDRILDDFWGFSKIMAPSRTDSTAIFETKFAGRLLKRHADDKL